MFQKWVVAFLADRGWRYLQQQRTRQKLQQEIKKRSKRFGKRAKSQRKQHPSRFKPRRALALLALGAGALAYFRSRQHGASDSVNYTSSRNEFGSINVNNAAYEPITAWAAPKAPTTAPLSNEPTYREQAGADVPQDTTVPPIAPEADAPTYRAQASGDQPASQDAAPESSLVASPGDGGASIDQSDTIAVPTPDHTDQEVSADAGTDPDPSTVAVPSSSENEDQPTGEES